MNKLTIAAAALLAASCAGMNGHDHSTEWVDFGPNPMTNPEFMAAWMASATPGEQHAELAKGVGHYTVEGTRWDAPGLPGIPMKATADVEMIMDGRYMVEHFHGDFEGMPFEGMLLMGYDNVSGRYWNVWVDNMSTGYMLSTGKEDADGSMALVGTARDAMTPGGRPMRMVHEQGAGGAFTMRMYDSTPDGGEFQVMELNYRR